MLLFVKNFLSYACGPLRCAWFDSACPPVYSALSTAIIVQKWLGSDGKTKTVHAHHIEDNIPPVSSYRTADPADSGDPLDRDTPRVDTTLAHRPSAGLQEPAAVSRLLRVITRFETNGLPAVTVSEHRPASAGDGLCAIVMKNHFK